MNLIFIFIGLCIAASSLNEIPIDCLRLINFINSKYKIGEELTLTSKSGNTYKGKYIGHENEFIILEKEDGKVIRLRSNKLDDSIISPDFPTPVIEPLPSNTTLEELVSKIASPSAREKARIFLKQLLEDREQIKEGEIPFNGRVKFINAELLLILKDPELDPDLHTWLKTVKDRFPPKNNSIQYAQDIAKYVKKTFKYEPNKLLHPIRTHRYKMMSENPKITKLGDFIKNGIGDCRHKAITLQLALQQAGISSRYITGRLKDNLLNESTRHAWVVLKDSNGKEFILDPQIPSDKNLEYHPDSSNSTVETPIKINKHEFEFLLSLFK